MLELRVVNNTSIAAVTSIISATSRSRLMQGLRVGTYYNVTLKSYASNSSVLSTSWVQSQTVAATPVISSSYGISSSAVVVTWTSQTGAESYYLMITLGSVIISQTTSGLNCTVDGLQSSSLYTLTLYAVNSAGPSAASKRMTVLTLTPPPMVVTVTDLNSYSVSLSWLTIEKALMYGIFVYEDRPTITLTFIRKTTSTAITLDTLQPCTKYIFGLTSYNWFYTPGEENRILHETGNLDPPQNITIGYSSNVETALLTWKPSIGAFLYLASAKSKLGHEVTCTTSSISCVIQGLLCEQRYFISVTAQTVSCSSNISEQLTLDTARRALCAPANVTVIRDCQINTVSLYWNPVTDAIKYTALAKAPDGSEEQCTNREPVCFFLNLLCGTEYSMSVFAFNGKTNGSRSPGILMRTAPCDPTNVEAIPSCQDNSMHVSWNQSSGAVSYVVSALGSSGMSYNCSSVDTSCQISGLHCGESISMFVIAYDDNCPSSNNNANQEFFIPCSPQTISAISDCENHLTHVHWHYSEGAVFYVAHANTNSGLEFTCESFDQDCFLSSLPCGEMYNVSVVASNYVCESRIDQTVKIMSVFMPAPCIPKNVETELNCDQNSILVKWSEDIGNATFRAIAEQTGAGFYNCTTQGTQCEITNINCGQLYSVSVQADNGQCISSTNWTAPFHSVPCRPTHVVAEANCGNSSVEVSWINSVGLGVNTYVASINGSDQLNLMCHSVSEFCLIKDTKCGEAYTATVTAVSDNCPAVSSVFYMDPVPCSPINLEAQATSTFVLLSWMNMPGAVNYTTDIVGDSGDEHTCQTSNTTCSLIDLMCGHHYRASVKAVGQHCSSKPSSTQEFLTAPCIPHSVFTQVNCVTNVVTVMWNGSLGAVYYTTRAAGIDGKLHVCNSTNASCDFSDLQCGSSYLVTVVATNEKSSSESSSPVELQMAPCVPEQVPPQINCVNNSVVLSWGRTLGAASYIANVTSPEDEAHLCQTETTECIINTLKCGQIYNVTVRAINAQCRSQPSASATLKTVPCQPQNVIAQMDCVSIVAHVSWNAVPGALRYITALKALGEEHAVCNSTDLDCVVSSLQCGQTYNVMVTASNHQCQSQSSFPAELYSGSQVTASVPCAPKLELALSPGQRSSSVQMVLLTWGSPVLSAYHCGPRVPVKGPCEESISGQLQARKMPGPPCIPQQVSTLANCKTNDALVSWSRTPSAENYTVLVIGPDTTEHLCNTTNTSCVIPALHCGLTYSVSVTAFNYQCQGMNSATIPLYTAPCAPERVRAETDCVSDSVTLSWDQMSGADNYIAYLVGSDGLNRTCSPRQSNCVIPNLPCGQSYMLTVSAANSQCNGPLSQTLRVVTVPCLPSNIRAELHCGTGTASLRWNPAAGATIYSAVVTEESGWNKMCSSHNTTCDIAGLECGQKYSVALTAINARYNSMASPVEFYTEPCIPSNVKAEVFCGMNMTSISWDKSPGAFNYTVIVTGHNGEMQICSRAALTCSTEALVCGQSYNVTVTAMGAFCKTQSTPVEFNSSPCTPQNVSAQTHCNNNTATLTWNPSSGAGSYISRITGVNGEEHYCNATGSSCDLSGTQCGHTYVVTVTAVNEQCHSEPSAPASLQTGPCIPEILDTRPRCARDLTTLSWGNTAGADRYMGILRDNSGKMLTCNSTEQSCDIRAMECGQTYTASVVAYNDQCMSFSNSSFMIETAPCVPPDLRGSVSCDTHSVTVSWDSARGADTYTINAHDGQNQNLCVTSNTSCVFNDLLCDNDYQFTITTSSASCNSTGDSSLHIKTIPCPPRILDVYATCENNSGTIHWEMSPNARSYKVIETGHSDTLQCNTSDTSCVLQNLQCGQNYTVTVWAEDGTCRGPDSPQVTFKSVPCSPRILNAYATCENNSGIIQWERGPNARSYQVIATGHSDTLQCNTSDTSCELQNLECGQNYTVTVWAEDGICRGPDSPQFTFQSVPCIPRNISSAVICGVNSLLVTWNASSGATGYSATAVGSQGQLVKTNTEDTTCLLPNLECGEVYNLTVLAMNDQCKSAESPVLEIVSAPCSPLHLMASPQCSPLGASASWESSVGAKSYTATFIGMDGDRTSCSTNITSCSVSGLHCGQVYNVTTTAYNNNCFSSTRNITQISSAPCVPTNAEVKIDCNGNLLNVTWSPSQGADSYTVNATGKNGHTLYCNTTTNGCNIVNAHCGDTYLISLTAHNKDCSSDVLTVGNFNAVPCIPDQVVVSLDCLTNEALVSWQNTNIYQTYYTVFARDFSDNELSCSNWSSSCAIPGLECGQEYSFWVTAANRNCHSLQSMVYKGMTAPCVAPKLRGSVSCDTHSVTVSWDSAHGADTYTISAHNGQNQSLCVTSNTSCEFNDLLCDNDYQFTITSSSASCNSTGDSSLHIKTIPCPPQIMDAHATCENNSGIIQWEMSPNARSYKVIATGHSDTLQCNTSDTSCELPSLECGQNYTVTVWAEDGTCRGPDSPQVTFQSVPCIPQNIRSTVMCGVDSLFVTWDASSGATGYSATAVGRQGQLVTANIVEPTCLLPNLECGQVYNLTVLAMNDECKSAKSPVLEIVSAPCSPLKLTASTQCSTHGASASWDPSAGAKSYTAAFKGTDGDRAFCSTNYTSCSVSGLHCGQFYNVSITAYDNNCYNSTTNITQISSAPCVPTNARANIDCSRNHINVTWNPSNGAESYTVIATTQSGHTLYCNTTTSGCIITHVHCGENYLISITAHNKDCSSDVLSVGYIDTVPCIPDQVMVDIDCFTNEAVLSWQENNTYLAYYSAVARDISGFELNCSTFSSVCRIPDLECGQEYGFSVIAKNQNCSSVQSAVYKKMTAPCVPPELRGSVSCDTHSVIVSWDSARGADTYTINAHDGQNQSLCVTSNTSCVFNDLLCDNDYQFTITSSSARCNSTGDSSLHIKTIPCPPRILDANAACDNNSGIIHWEMSPNARSYKVIATGHSDTLQCNTSDTSCELQNLECGQNYTVTVWAEDGTCRGPDSPQVTFKSVPCIPQNISSAVICRVNSLLVTWNVSSGATGYSAAAVGSQGQLLTTNIEDTTCLLPNLECGEVYYLTVLAMNDECKSAESPVLEIVSAPCSPLHLTASPQCSPLGASASWESSIGAKSYTAIFIGMDGDRTSCSTNDTSCSVSGLHCGQVYNVTATAYDNNCFSSTTNITQISSAPCVPTNAVAKVDCSGNYINVTWGPSHGAESYMVTATGKTGHTLYCNTTTNGCSVMNVHCSDNYIISLIAQNKDCSSDVLTVGNLDTVPCIPDNVAVDIECLTNEALVSWQDKNSYYTVVAHDLSDNEFSCSTFTNSCRISGLNCGQEYSFLLTAQNRLCSSSQSNAHKTMTAPCQPQDLTQSLDCEGNIASLSWSASRGAVYYLATLSGNGTTIYFNTTDTNYSSSALTCGQSYNASVVALDNKCRSISSATTTFDTAPCQPQNLATEFDCNTQIAALLWDKTDGAWLYNITIHSAKEGTFSYSTADNFFNELLYCGQTYSFTVSAVGGTCNSSRSLTHYQTSAPCHPQDLIERLDCESNNASLSWSESGGAVYYLASLSGNGTTVYCNTTDTSCSFPALTCGQSYNASVVTMDNKCRSVLSATTTFDTAPCQPQDLIENVACESNNASLSWSASIGAVYYLASLSGNGTTAYCNTTDTSCSFPTLACGQSYNASVVALDNKCRSVSSATTTFNTVPCVPQNTKVFTDCKNNSATFLWERRSEALSYLAIVHEDDNYVHTCDTDNTECLVSNLNCGSTYSFSVLATDLKCNSSFSSPVLAGVVPCPPGQVKTLIYHRTVKPQEVEITWNGSHCGEEYMATVQGEIGNDAESSFILHSYWTSYMDFYIPVPCSSSYNVTVTARNLAGVSDPSEPIKGCTAPCSPRVNDPETANGNMLLSWYQSTNTEEYRVLDIADNITVCRTSALSCEIPFRNSTLYLIAVNTAGESEPVFFSWSI
ncbi:serine-rich adhesin for platelets-like [Pelobates cultripes]|uniref:Serine-rich adhesin for platelets-like n=1 Tax=Pelobates cultripes TaxID=61616 RepID=A0AAD1WKZ8_PELCU|nr:serine-rich adhesin for platelets-like [Pelobates cultripes]